MNIKGIVRGILFSYLIAAVFLFAAAAAVYFNLINERVASVAVFIAMLCGAFFGALGAARTAEKKLLFNALAVSLAFSVGITAAAAAVNGGFVMSLRTVMILCGSVGAGAAAAIFAA